QQVPGNEACESRGVKPKGSLNHPGEPGEGKIGRVNASELLRRLRQRKSPEPMVYTAMMGRTAGTATVLPRPGNRPCPRQGHQDSGVQEAPTPIVSHWCQTRQLRCGLDASPVSPTIFGREAQFHSGHMKVQEAKAAGRKAQGIHNLADRVN